MRIETVVAALVLTLPLLAACEPEDAIRGAVPSAADEVLRDATARDLHFIDPDLPGRAAMVIRSQVVFRNNPCVGNRTFRVMTYTQEYVTLNFPGGPVEWPSVCYRHTLACEGATDPPRWTTEREEGPACPHPWFRVIDLDDLGL